MNSPAFVDKSLLYERVRETLRERCQRETSDTLPSLRLLSREMGVNHFTISRALRDLECDGLVKIVPRRGIFIQDKSRRPRHKRIELVTLHTDLHRVSSCLLQGVQELAGNNVAHQTILGRPSLLHASQLIKELQERDVEGVLFNGVGYFQYPHSLAEANLIQDIAQQLPIVIVGGTHPIIAADCVYGDTRSATRKYLDQCVRLGFERYAYLGASSQRPANRERYECFKNFILEHRLGWNESWITYGTEEPYRERISRLLKNDEKPQVVIAYNADCAYSVIIEAQRRGIRPGQDIHILALVNFISDATALQSEATVILLDELEVGRRAYEMLQKKVSEPFVPLSLSCQPPRIERLPARFVNNLLEE